MDRPDPAAVLELAAAARAADGVSPLSEATLLSLQADPSDRDLHGFVRGEGRLDGYAHLRLEDDGAAWAEVVVHPEARQQGIGRRFLEYVREQSAGARVWAHGDTPAAQATAQALGMTPVRNLWMMSRSVDLGEPIADPVAPQGFSTRTFQPGDEQTWLDVNARAFAHHPEQGRMTLADLRARMTEPWFDPGGLFLVFDEESGRLAASHWTKVAEEGGPGEVYVVAVDPDFQGSGLGGYVTALGLAHLRDQGVSTIDLYVEGDNTPAIATYRRKGFERSAHDVMYGWGQT
ncbi:mycothiol synthase [Yimella sp. cx-573]|nr:mycothiol synthase [Yimella sp. cx-573]